MSMQNKLKIRGIIMLIPFFALLGIIFTPVFPNKMNGLDYMDNLFNKVSKGSSYFIPEWMTKADKSAGKSIEAKINMANDKEAEVAAALFTGGGAQVAVSGSELSIKGDISGMVKAALADADALFHNNGKPVADKYGYNEKQVVSTWWSAFGKISKNLTKQEEFAAAKLLDNIQKKALEPAYNYYGVGIENWKDNIGFVLAALAFYVIYTVWYGFGLMYLFEGLGLKASH